MTKKNLEVSKLIDEDPLINITHQYLLKLAQYCVHNTHFNSISRTKAREYSRQLAPYRTWSKDLLNACLTTNLLLEDQSITGEHAVMFEYENLGDYYMATAMIDSWKSLPAILNLICQKKKYFDKHPEVSDHKFCNSVKALFDCLHCSGVEVQNETPIKKGQVLYDLYYEYLIESEIDHDKPLDILLKLDEDKINPIILLQEKTDLSLEDTLTIHNKLMEYKTIGRRDLIWTLFVNQMYDWNGTDYIAYIQDNGFFSLKSEDEQTQTIIFLTWLLTSSYPSFRAFIMRMLTSLFYSNTSLISKAIGLFGKVNDPYVSGGLFCFISGVLLVSRDIETVTSIAHQIYDLYYKKPESVPQDLIVRQWTLKIIERAHYLDKECNLWNFIKTPFKPMSEDSPRLSEFNPISKNIFGLQQGSLMMYESIFGFSDFNRYIIGTNYNSRSNDYFVGTDDGQYNGYSLSDIKAEMSYYIKDIFGWNDKLGRLDNGKYSMDRQYNEKERIGKKFQWLAWYRINAHLMDV